MHGTRRLLCQKSERIPFVAARCVLFESAAERTSKSRILWRSAFIFADKNGVVIVGALINCTVCNALLYELIVNTTPEKILQNSVAVLKLRRQEKHLWLIFFLGMGGGFQSANACPVRISTASTKSYSLTLMR